ncbi:MAG: hypothetical protein AB7N65_30305, partial [Vicinamibacterales bacterium]
MTFLRVRRHALTCAAVMTLLLPMPASVAAAADHDNQLGNRPLTVRFTKWRVNAPVVPLQFTGKARGRAAGVFFAEVLQVQSTAFPSLRNSLTRLEAVYEVQT